MKTLAFYPEYQVFVQDKQWGEKDSNRFSMQSQVHKEGLVSESQRGLSSVDEKREGTAVQTHLACQDGGKLASLTVVLPVDMVHQDHLPRKTSHSSAFA